MSEMLLRRRANRAFRDLFGITTAQSGATQAQQLHADHPPETGRHAHLPAPALVLSFDEPLETVRAQLEGLAS